MPRRVSGGGGSQRVIEEPPQKVAPKKKAAKKKKTPKSIADQIADTLKEKLSGEKTGT